MLKTQYYPFDTETTEELKGNPNDLSDHLNHIAHYPDLDAWVSCSKGTEGKGEDFAWCATLPEELLALPTDQISKILSNACERLQAKYCEFSEATATLRLQVLLPTSEGLYLIDINAGHSLAYSYNTQGEFQSLNDDVHKAIFNDGGHFIQGQDETNRICQNYFPQIDYQQEGPCFIAKLGAITATRGLGGVSLRTKGYSNKVQNVGCTLLPAKDEIWHIMASDGIGIAASQMEGNALRLSKEPPQTIMTELTKLARDHGETAAISMIMLKIDPQKPLTVPILMALSDGSGGKEVAYAAYQNLGTCIAEELVENSQDKNLEQLGSASPLHAVLTELLAQAKEVSDRYHNVTAAYVIRTLARELFAAAVSSTEEKAAGSSLEIAKNLINLIRLINKINAELLLEIPDGADSQPKYSLENIQGIRTFLEKINSFLCLLVNLQEPWRTETLNLVHEMAIKTDELVHDAKALEDWYNSNSSPTKTYWAAKQCILMAKQKYDVSTTNLSNDIEKIQNAIKTLEELLALDGILQNSTALKHVAKLTQRVAIIGTTQESAEKARLTPLRTLNREAEAYLASQKPTSPPQPQRATKQSAGSGNNQPSANATPPQQLVADQPAGSVDKQSPPNAAPPQQPSTEQPIGPAHNPDIANQPPQQEPIEFDTLMGTIRGKLGNKNNRKRGENNPEPIPLAPANVNLILAIGDLCTRLEERAAELKQKPNPTIQGELVKIAEAIDRLVDKKIAGTLNIPDLDQFQSVTFATSLGQRFDIKRFIGAVVLAAVIFILVSTITAAIMAATGGAAAIPAIVGILTFAQSSWNALAIGVVSVATVLGDLFANRQLNLAHASIQFGIYTNPIRHDLIEVIEVAELHAAPAPSPASPGS